MAKLGYKKDVDYVIQNGRLQPKELSDKDSLGQTQQESALRTLAFLKDTWLQTQGASQRHNPSGTNGPVSK